MSDYLATIAAHLDREPVCTCTTTDRGTDTLGCPAHDPDFVQWDLDHPDGEISDDEALVMAEYAMESAARFPATASAADGRVRGEVLG